MFDHSDLSSRGCCVQGGVPSLVLTTDLSPLIHQEAHYIQVTCRATPTLNALYNVGGKKPRFRLFKEFVPGLAFSFL